MLCQARPTYGSVFTTVPRDCVHISCNMAANAAVRMCADHADCWGGGSREVSIDKSHVPFKCCIWPCRNVASTVVLLCAGHARDWFSGPLVQVSV